MKIDRKWLPYLIAVLYTFTAEQTWSSDQQRVIGEAQNLILEFERLLSCDLPAPEPSGITFDEECNMQLRICGGKLQVCECGVWKDVPSCDGDATVFPPTQPGDGQPQPSPGGGTQHYCGAMGGLQKWLLPTRVSTGDQLLMSQLNGAWNDGVEVFWHCANGWIYAVGACTVNPIYNGGTDPLMGERHMKIIAEIGGSFYDVLNDDDFTGVISPFTVPGGIVDQQVVLQANVDYGGNIYGDVSFCIDVTNNQEVFWTSVLNFALASHTDFVTAEIGDYEPLVGYTSVGTDPSNQGVVQLKLNFDSANIDKMTMFYSSDANGAGTNNGSQMAFPASSIAIPGGAGIVSGSSNAVVNNTPAVVHDAYARVDSGTVAANMVIYSVAIEGHGAKPVQFP